MKGVLMEVKQHGIYILKDSYYKTFDTGKMMDNKQQNRPHYLAIEMDGVFWMIPLSSKVGKYSAKIQEAEKSGRECLYYHIGKIAGKDSAFLIADMIPISPKHICREYTISGVPYIVKDKDLNRKILKKAKRYLLLVRQNRIKPHVDILKIERALTKR